MADQSVPITPTDLAVVFIAPTGPDDVRVPTAPDVTGVGEVAMRLARQSRQSVGWVTPPTVTIAPPRGLTLGGGRARIPIAPSYDVDVPSGTIQVPALPSVSSVVNRLDRLSLVGLAAEVGGEQDTALGSIVFAARSSTGAIVQSSPKENTRRYRFFWLWVLSPDILTPDGFYQALNLNSSGDRILTIANKTATGFVLGDHRIYALDPNWVATKTYKILPQIDVLNTISIRRLQNFADRGYTWGNGGEEPLDPRFALTFTGRLVDSDLANVAQQRLVNLLAGRPGSGSTYARSVQNFSAGAVIGNVGRVGEAASSPNNSVCLPSPNRVSYTNEAYMETLAVAKLTAGNDGNGNALLTVPLESCPAGSRFSEIAANHKIYALSGEEISSFGRFQNLGGVGALTWIADANQKLLPGQTAYFCPAVNLPAGSGLSVPFEAIEMVWNGATGAPLKAANIRDGSRDDLAAYAAPADGDDFIVVYGAERAAIHAIYKRVQVTTNGFGVATIPESELGCFAFLSGVSGRIDKPVVAGLSANTTYQALVYYPPRQSEAWQFQLRFTPYAGIEPLAALAWLDGARVVGHLTTIVHTQGGGGSIFRSGGELQFSPIAMHLPITNSPTPYYTLNALAQLEGEAGQGYVTYREVTFLPAPDRALPSPGQVLRAEAATINHPRSIRGRLLVGDRLLGFRLPRLDGNKPFQAVVAFVVEKAGVRRLVVATQCGSGGVTLSLDSDTGCGLGLFDL